MEIVIFWVIFALVVSFIAINKCRSGMRFFILSILQKTDELGHQ